MFLLFVLFTLLFLTFKAKADNPIGFKNNEVIISQVQLLVDGFINDGDKDYDYLGNFLPVFLESALKRIPFFTLTENQKSQLISGISLNNYIERFTGNYLLDQPLVYVKPKLEPVVLRGKNGILPFSISFYGKYKVKNNRVHLEIFMSSRYVSFEKNRYSLEASVDNLIQNPEFYFLKYIKYILSYRVFTISLNVEPEDSIVSIDDKVVGFGKIRNILLTAGPHKLHIHRDGFHDYDDVITVLNNGFRKSISLKSLNYKKLVKIVTDPPKAEVYLNEKFEGETPLLLNISSYNDVITIIKKGYLDAVVYPLKYKGKSKIDIRLNPIPEIVQTNISGEKFKRNSKMLYYSGIGFLASTIILAAESTLYKQKADLYKNSNQGEYQNAIDKKNLYGALATASAFSSVVVFTFSFKDILKYFKEYEAGD